MGDGQHEPADLREAGAREVYATLAELNAHFDEAISIASPGAIQWSDEKIEELMRAALQSAREGMENGELPIGAILCDGDGAIVARGHNCAHATGSHVAHAEMLAFADAAEKLASEDNGAILVTTLEPCVMCAGAAMEANIESVVYGMKAPFNGGVARVSGIRTPGARFPRFLGGVLADESRALLQNWLDGNPNAGGAAIVQQLLGAAKS